MDANAIITSEAELRRVVSSELANALPKLLPSSQPSQRPKEWLSNREAMDFLDLSKATLQRYCDRGILSFSKIGGNIYYRYSDLVALLEEHMQ